jgi:hypothetical protein
MAVNFVELTQGSFARNELAFIKSPLFAPTY